MPFTVSRCLSPYFNGLLNGVTDLTGVNGVGYHPSNDSLLNFHSPGCERFLEPDTLTPISPKDLLETSFHLLRIDPHTLVRDQLGRPVPIAGAGTVRQELIG